MLRAEVSVSSSEENQIVFYPHLFTVLTMIFTRAASPPTSYPFMVVALSLLSFGGEEEGVDWVVMLHYVIVVDVFPMMC